VQTVIIDSVVTHNRNLFAIFVSNISTAQQAVKPNDRHKLRILCAELLLYAHYAFCCSTVFAWRIVNCVIVVVAHVDQSLSFCIFHSIFYLTHHA